jgi:transglutaminase-like putative cysteine protease
LRRRIGDPTSLSSVYVRGGTAFIAITVASAFILTQTASSAPLAGAWGGIGDGLLSISKSVARFLPTGGKTHSFGVSFGADVVVGQVWNPGEGTAVTIDRNPTDDRDHYWRATTYDRIDLNGWGRSSATRIPRPAGTSILEGLADDVDPAGLDRFTFTVHPDGYRDSTVLSPQTPVRVDEVVRLTYLGQAGYFATLDRDGGTGPYSVTALVAIRGDEPGQLNSTALREAGTSYPDEIRDLFLDVTEGSLGENALRLKAKIRADARSAAPIDLAEQLVKELHSSAYTYARDISDVDCTGLSTVECFATHKQGFCQYYAATMAVILRSFGVPTRIARGFLPGSRDASAGTELVLMSQDHAWVEVYFPGYGWVMFDPTGGGLAGQIGPLPSGRPAASASPGGSSIPGPAATLGLRGEFDDGPSGPIARSITPGSFGPLVAMTVLLLLVMGGLAFVVWQRGPRGATTADAAYGMVTRIASRFGFGPRPAQTVYEYAGTLGDVLPEVRPELETVARAKVESVYAREVLGADRVETLRAAQRRLRVALLRLVLRRQERRRRRH